MKFRKAIAATSMSAMLAAPALAEVETEGTFRQAVEHLYQEPGEFTVNSQSDVEVVHFKEARDVRLCLPDARHVVALEVEYDDKSKVLQPGNCLIIEAKEVALSVAGDLKDGWSLHGTFETVRKGS
ncbi:hypothetical protein [Litorivivens sp.]|uniref:hypothetical protein n=1 Tax=Litorivivens sp. TaxID=2020868 RepID=UPI003566CF84